MNNKPDQPFYKRWWLFIALVIVFSIGAMTEGLIKTKTETIKKRQTRDEEIIKEPSQESEDLDEPEEIEEEIEEPAQDDEVEEEVEKELDDEEMEREEELELDEPKELEEPEESEEPQANLETSVKDKVNKVIGDKAATINIRDEKASIKVNLEENNMDKTDISTETKNILEELSKVKELSEVEVNYTLEEDIVLYIVMTRETLDGINWDSFNIEDFEGLKLNEERITN